MQASAIAIKELKDGSAGYADVATALARHSQNGWHNAALPDDFEAIGQLLNLSTLAVRSLVRTIDLTTEDPAY